MHDFYSNGPSSNTAKAHNFFLQNFVFTILKLTKRGWGWPIKIFFAEFYDDYRFAHLPQDDETKGETSTRAFSNLT